MSPGGMSGMHPNHDCGDAMYAIALILKGLHEISMVVGVCLTLHWFLIVCFLRLEIHSLHDLGWYVRQGVHFGLFMGALMGQGSEEQRAEWLPRVS